MYVHFMCAKGDDKDTVMGPYAQIHEETGREITARGGPHGSILLAYLSADNTWYVPVPNSLHRHILENGTEVVDEEYREYCSVEFIDNLTDINV